MSPILHDAGCPCARCEAARIVGKYRSDRGLNPNLAQTASGNDVLNALDRDDQASRYLRSTTTPTLDDYGRYLRGQRWSFDPEIVTASMRAGAAAHMGADAQQPKEDDPNPAFTNIYRGAQASLGLGSTGQQPNPAAHVLTAQDELGEAVQALIKERDQLRAQLDQMTAKANALSVELRIEREQWAPDTRTVGRCRDVLRAFLAAPVSLSSLQPILALARELTEGQQ